MRIDQSSGFLLTYAREARAGRLAPAGFQRPYVWSRSDVEAMWSSMLSGYPLGSLLIWKPTGDVDFSRLSRARLGPTSTRIDEPDIILDGQNRLATLAWSSRAWNDPTPTPVDMSVEEKATWDSGKFLVADCRSREIKFVDPSVAADLHCFAPGLLVDASISNPIVAKRYAQAKFTDDQIDWLVKTVPDAVREARVTVTTLEHATPEKALDAFRHIARVGVPMSEQDFEAAMAWALPASPGLSR